MGVRQQCPSSPKGYNLDRRWETTEGACNLHDALASFIRSGFLVIHDEREVTMTATVLVVGADPLNRNCADWEAILLGQGYEVIEARGGEAALAICPHLQPDLVLLNELLPDIHGFEVCRRLKADPRNRLTPVVLLKASGDSAADVLRGFEAGADDFWGHSPTLEEALSWVHSLLQLKTYIDEQAESVIFSLAHSLEARDSCGGGHCSRVSNHAVRFGKSLGLSQDDLDTLRIGGLVHDIGKIGVPDSILSKPGPLDPEEIRIVKQHPILGEQICAPLKSLRHVLPIIRHHHERMNGSGYPDGLQGKHIPLTVRILQIVDICDALTSDRSYRKSLSLPRALIVLFEEADRGWLDEGLVSQFASLVVGSENSVALGNRGRLRPSEVAKWSESNSSSLLNRRAM
jgi:putative two-component system response regulator